MIFVYRYIIMLIHCYLAVPAVLDVLHTDGQSRKLFDYKLLVTPLDRDRGRNTTMCA